MKLPLYLRIYFVVMTIILSVATVGLVMLNLQSYNYWNSNYPTGSHSINAAIGDITIQWAIILLLPIIGLTFQWRRAKNPQPYRKIWVILRICIGLPVVLILATILYFLLSIGHIDCGNSCAPGILTTNQTDVLAPIIYLSFASYILIPGIYQLKNSN